MSGLEVLDALRAATNSLVPDSEFELNRLDAIDLEKLTVRDLQSRGFSEAEAERVSTDLLAGNLAELGFSLGLRLSSNHHARKLIPPETTSETEE